MEETIQPQFLEQRWKDKLAAGFTNSAGMSGDKLLALQQLAGFAAQHGMIWITLGQLLGWQTSVGSADDPNRLASFLGLMAQSNVDQGPDLAPPPVTGRRPSGLAGGSARRPTAGLGAATGCGTPNPWCPLERRAPPREREPREGVLRVPTTACEEVDYSLLEILASRHRLSSFFRHSGTSIFRSPRGTRIVGV